MGLAMPNALGEGLKGTSACEKLQELDVQSPVRERDSSWERPFWGGEGTEGGATGDEDGFRFVPLRLLDPTECFWNAFLRLGNLAIVNCVSVVTTHPLSVDLVRRAAEDLARRHQALRLVIRLADASRVQRLQRSQREQVLAAAESLKGPACLGLDQAWPLLHFPPALTNSAASSTWSRRHSPLVENFFSLPSLGNNPRLSEAGTCCSALRAGLPQTYHPLGGTQSSPEEGPRRVSSSLKRDAAPPSAAQLCSCRRRRQFKFAFQERLGDVKVDVREATAPHWISSSGFPWPPDEAEGEDGPLWRLRVLPSQPSGEAEPIPCGLPDSSAASRVFERTQTSPLDQGLETQSQEHSQSGGRFKYRTYIVAVFHHCIMDGLSRKHFWEELLKLVAVDCNASLYAKFAQDLGRAVLEEEGVSRVSRRGEVNRRSLSPGSAPTPCCSRKASQQGPSPPTPEEGKERASVQGLQRCLGPLSGGTTVLPPGLNDVFPSTVCVDVLRPLMSLKNLSVQLYLTERRLLRGMRNPFVAFFPPSRFKTGGKEYAAFKLQQQSPSSDAAQGQGQSATTPPDANAPLAFTGIIAMRLSRELSHKVAVACKRRGLTVNGIITTAAAVGLARLLWRRPCVLREHALLGDLARALLSSSQKEELSSIQEEELSSNQEEEASPAEASLRRRRVSSPPFQEAASAGQPPAASGLEEEQGLTHKTRRSLRDASSRGGGLENAVSSLVQLAELLQQATLRSSVVASESTLGLNETREEYLNSLKRHRGAVYFYSLQAVSGRRWVDALYSKPERQVTPLLQQPFGRRSEPRDEQVFTESLFRRMQKAIDAERPPCVAAKCQWTESDDRPAVSSQTNATVAASRTRLNGARSSREASSSRPRPCNGGRDVCAISTVESVPDFFCGEKNPDSSRAPDSPCVSSSLGDKGASASALKKLDPAADEASFSRVRERVAPATAEAGVLRSLTRALRSLSLWLKGAVSLDGNCRRRRRQQQGQQELGHLGRAPCQACSVGLGKALEGAAAGVPGSSGPGELLKPFGLGSYALLMPLRLRVSEECNARDAEAVWALARDCTKTVQRFASLGNPSWGTYNFQLISAFVKRLAAELECLLPFRDDKFVRPSAFLISNGGIWSDASLKTFFKRLEALLLTEADALRLCTLQNKQSSPKGSRAAESRRRRQLAKGPREGKVFLGDPSLDARREGTAESRERLWRRGRRSPPKGEGLSNSRLRRRSFKRPTSAAGVLRKVEAQAKVSRERRRRPSLTLGEAATSGLSFDQGGFSRTALGSEEQPRERGGEGEKEKEKERSAPGLPKFEPFVADVESSWSVVSQHATGLNHFAHNCVTVRGRINWSLQFHSNLVSRELAALYAMHVMRVLEESVADSENAAAEFEKEPRAEGGETTPPQNPPPSAEPNANAASQKTSVLKQRQSL